MPDLEEVLAENRRLKLELERVCRLHEPHDTLESSNSTALSNELTLGEYQRYGRQLIMPEVGRQGQKRLKNARVLIIGAGGLGCPAIAYLAGAGVGTIGIVDHDTVEISNLHRQILHRSCDVGVPKAESAKRFIHGLNPNVKVNVYKTALSPINSFEIFTSAAANEPYDLVLDCTDTPRTRYLINDTAVILGIPLVSASALKTEGQLSVLNYSNGPCYRCLFPIPPPPDSVTSCGDGGILGPVVGVMGVMQAVEAIKVLVAPKNMAEPEFKPSLLLFSAFSAPQWRHIRMRGRKPACIACGDSPTISQVAIESGEIDYEEFCGTATTTKIHKDERVSVQEYAKLRSNTTKKHVLLDVRDAQQFDICALDGSVNVPYAQLKRDPDAQIEPNAAIASGSDLYVICRYGNDSQGAVRLLKDKLKVDNIWDVEGGLDKWSRKVDPGFPRY